MGEERLYSRIKYVTMEIMHFFIKPLACIKRSLLLCQIHCLHSIVVILVMCFISIRLRNAMTQSGNFELIIIIQ